MKREYPQWQKIFAHPKVITGIAILTAVITFFVLNILFNCIYHLKDLLYQFKYYTGSNIDEPIPLLKANYFLPTLGYKWFLMGYIVGFLIVGVVLSKKLHDVRIAFRDLNVGTKGTARFTTPEEIPQQYRRVKLGDEEYEGHSGIPIYSESVITVDKDGKEKEERYVYIDDNKTNSLTVGSTQSGKTQTFSYPLLDLIMRAKIKDSVIVNDLKGDMFKNTKDEFERFGYDVYCLNLVDPLNGIRYNPLELVKQAYLAEDFTKAQMLANSLSYNLYHNPHSKEPMWEEASISLLNALILAICGIGVETKTPEVINMYAVTSMLEELGAYPDEKGYTALDGFFDNLPSTSVARKQYGTIKFSQGITRSGIFTGTMAKLKNYTYDAIAKMTAGNDINLADFGCGKKPIALFIMYPDWNDSNYSIIATFLSQLNEVLAEKALSYPSGELPRRVRYLFEEAMNIPVIDGLSRQMNVGLGRGLIHHLVVQSIAQIEDKYGDKLSTAITGACGNQIYIMSDELDDAEYFSKKLGERTVVTIDRNGDPLSIDKSYGEREDSRPLMYAHEMRGLKKGEWIIDRTKKREDLEGNAIDIHPIFCNYKDGSRMLHSYEYLSHKFNKNVSIITLNLGENHKEIKLEDIIVKFSTVEVPVNENEKATENHQQENETPQSGNTEHIQGVGNVKHWNSKEENNIESHLVLQKDKTKGEMKEAIDGIAETETWLGNIFSSQQYNFLHEFAKESLSETEYEYFRKLETVEEVSSFLCSSERKGLKKAFEDLLKQKGGEEANESERNN